MTKSFYLLHRFAPSARQYFIIFITNAENVDKHSIYMDA